MCIAILRDVGTTISKKTLRQCFSRNRDGAGFSYINEDEHGVRRIRIKKDMDFNTFYKRLRIAERENPNSPFLIHFRIETSGGVRVENNHPFQVDKKHAFIHNGIINSMNKEIEGIESDTRAFNRVILRNLDKGWMHNKVTKTLIESFIGHSKLAVLNIDYDYTIYNEDMGEWKDGIWYSNTSYKPIPPYRGGYYQGKYQAKESQTLKTKAKARGWGQSQQWGKEADKAIESWQERKKKDEKKEEEDKKKGEKGKSNIVPFCKQEDDDPYPMKLVDMNKDLDTEATDLVLHRACACCGSFISIKEMEYYRLATMDAECYCPDCASVMLKNFIIKPEDEISYQSFLDCIDDDTCSKLRDAEAWEEYYEGFNGGYCG